MPDAVSRHPRSKTRDLRFAVKVRAEPRAVYQALTSARGLSRLGAREGVFVDLEPGKKVAWLFKPGRGERRPPPLVSMFIGRRRGPCEVVLLHAGFDSGPSSDGLYRDYARLWEDGLAKLKRHLEAGRARKRLPAGPRR